MNKNVLTTSGILPLTKRAHLRSKPPFCTLRTLDTCETIDMRKLSFMSNLVQNLYHFEFFSHSYPIATSTILSTTDSFTFNAIQQNKQTKQNNLLPSHWIITVLLVLHQNPSNPLCNSRCVMQHNTVYLLVVFKIYERLHRTTTLFCIICISLDQEKKKQKKNRRRREDYVRIRIKNLAL